jgi:predicted negative regulator of RcsB-dependent stress response
VDRLTRKELKTDKFAEEVFDIFEWVSENRSVVIRYGIAVAVLAAIGFGILFYNRHQADVRQAALANAMRIDEATVGDNVQPTRMHFDTEDAKAKARTQAFSEIAAKYSGTQEGAIAEIYLGGYAADAGNLAEAEKHFKRVVEEGPAAYASVARLSLAQVYASEGKMNEAEKVMREAISHPSATVSKEQAQIVLGQLLAKSNPAEAHKLLDPLRTSMRGPVSRAAITAAGNLPQDSNPAAAAPGK